VTVRPGNAVLKSTRTQPLSNNGLFGSYVRCARKVGL
jgi:hypothetical protein